MPSLKNSNFDKAFIIGSILVVIYLFYPAINANIQYITNVELIGNDSLIYLPPYYKYLPDSVPSTYQDEYILNALSPIGYKTMYIAAAKFYDPITLSKFLPYNLLIFTIIAIGYASYKLSGALGSICAILMTLAFSADILISTGLDGGTPRTFAYPIIALVALGLIQCRPYLLATLTLFSSLFYPMAGVISGCAMALMMLLPSAYRPTLSDWSLKKRMSFIIAVAAFSGLILSSQFLASTEYGPRVTPETVHLFPEAGAEGVYQPGDTLPNSYAFTWAMQFFKYTFVPNGTPFFDLDQNKELYKKITILLWGFIFFAIAIGLQQIVKPENAPVVRLLLLFLAGLLLFILAVTAQPYLYYPKRYFMFTIPIFATIIYPYALIRLLNQVKYINDNNLSGKITIITSLILVLLCGGRGYIDNAAPLLPEGGKTFLEKVAKLDNNSIIAGMPYDTAFNQIRFYSRKNIFISRWENHALHEDSILNIREKIKSTVKANYATDIHYVKKIRDDHNITHIFINEDDYIEAPKGFSAPIRTFAHETFHSQKDKAIFNNNAMLQSMIVLQYDKYTIYDINKVIDYYENRP